MCDKRQADNANWSAVSTGGIKFQQIHISRKWKMHYLNPY